MHHNDVDFIQSCLDALGTLHQERVRPRVDFSKQDPRHAVYLMQGAGITNAYIGLQLFKFGYQNHLMQTMRFLLELRNLAEFIVILREGDRHLKTWFAGTIVKAPRPKGRTIKPEEVGPLPNDPVARVEWAKKAGKVVYDAYSESHHPTIGAVRFNANPPGDFNYVCDQLAGRGIDNLPLEQGLLMPALQFFGIGQKVGLVSREEYISVVRERIVETEIRISGKSSLPPLPVNPSATP